jgi:hypothetical protein
MVEKKTYRPYVPLHIVVAEICKDESLNDFGEKHHRRPQTIAQSSQQTATSIQNLQNRSMVAYYTTHGRNNKKLSTARHESITLFFKNYKDGYGSGSHLVLLVINKYTSESLSELEEIHGSLHGHPYVKILYSLG